MTRTLRLAIVIVVAVLGCTRPAHASLWDVLEELSGPGPFDPSGVNALVSGFCRSVRQDGNVYSSPKRLGIPGQVQVRQGDGPARAVNIPPFMPCFWIDFRPLASNENDNFPVKVHAVTAETGITFPLVRPIEIGAGIGWIRFHTGDISTNRMTLTPLRLVIKPLFFIPSHQANNRLAFLKYYVKETVIIGRLRGEDFGVSNDVFDNKTGRDWVTSAGFIIDFGELFGP